MRRSTGKIKVSKISVGYEVQTFIGDSIWMYDRWSQVEALLREGNVPLVHIEQMKAQIEWEKQADAVLT
jgi:hypothetical protein